MARERTFRHPDPRRTRRLPGGLLAAAMLAGCPFGPSDVFVDECCFGDTFGRIGDTGLPGDGPPCDPLIVSRSPGPGETLDAWQTLVVHTAVATRLQSQDRMGVYDTQERAVPPGVVHLLSPTAPWPEGTTWTVETLKDDTSVCSNSVSFTQPIAAPAAVGEPTDATWLLSGGAARHPDSRWLARRIDTAAEGGLALGVALQGDALVVSAHGRASGWPTRNTTSLPTTFDGGRLQASADAIALGDLVLRDAEITVTPLADGTARLHRLKARVDLRGMAPDALALACEIDPPLGLPCVPCVSDDDTDTPELDACVHVDVRGVPLELRR